MSKRSLGLGSIGVAAVITAVVVLLKLAPVTRAGDAVRAGPAPKTPWGEPDLQGIWTNNYEIPLQRPARYANKEFFTDEERAELDQQRTSIIDRQANETRRTRGTEQDVSGAYNQAIFVTHKHVGRRTSLIVDPPDGRIPPLTPEAQKRRDAIRAFQLALLQATDTCKNKLPGCAGGKYGAPSPRRAEAPPYYVATGAMGGGSINRADGPEDRTLGERCMGAILPDFGGLAGFFPQIVQSPGTLSIFYDTGQGQGWQRVIPLTSRSHLPSHVRQWWGDSRGHWEGNTLVVDVTNFTPKTDFQGSRENLHVVERWTRIGPTTLEYAVTVEDPTVWARPWTAKQEFVLQNNEENRIYSEPRCIEGNYGLPGLLHGHRVQERAFANGLGVDPRTISTIAVNEGEPDPLQ